MATALVDEDVDLMACGVCFHRYDLEDKKPKFLQCSHSLCLPCAKGILKGGCIRCPFCRLTFSTKDADSLPNNNYATKILVLMKKSEETSTETAKRKLALCKWCPVCQKAENSLCTIAGHSTMNITSKNMERIQQVKTAVIKMKVLDTDSSARVIQKRKLMEEVKKLKDNLDIILDIILAKMMSL